jgi:DNA-binding transcriptional ArsR family regulator
MKFPPEATAGNARKVVLKQLDTTQQIEAMRVHAADAAGLMKARGNESRLMILCALSEGELSVGDLNSIVPLSQSALSQQLARLREQGLVDTRRQSQTIFYSLSPGPSNQVIQLLHDIYCSPRSGR